MLEAYMAVVPYDEENAWRYSRACYELAQVCFIHPLPPPFFPPLQQN